MKKRCSAVCRIFWNCSLVLIFWCSAVRSAEIHISSVPFDSNQQSRFKAEGGADPNTILVKFKRGKKGEFLPGSVAKSFRSDPQLFLVSNPRGLSFSQALEHYRSNPNVLYSEPNLVLQVTDTIPSDPRWNEQWDMSKIAAPQAWDLQTDSGDIVVGVMDTGIDFSHPDLQGNLWTDPVSGAHGFDCFDSVTPGGLDDFGHGTHVAGTIGAVANNGIGVAGINWDVQLISFKFLNSSGSGLLSDAILCFDKATELKQSGVNIRLINNSWGAYGFSQSLKDAMARAEGAGILNVCAAGNNAINNDVTTFIPASYDNRGIISVLATDPNDIGAWFTNYGLARVDIAAPGVATLSTVPTGSCALCDPSGYLLLSGTSMASPHVAGVLAALFHRNPNLSIYEARDIVLDPNSYDPVTDPRAATSTTAGRLNFFRTLTNPLVFSPVLNNFPGLILSPDITKTAGENASLSISASDSDGDPLRTTWNKIAPAGSWPDRGWLLAAMMDLIFPDPTGNVLSFIAPQISRTATMPYTAAVADNRGGSNQGANSVNVLGSATTGQPPAGTFTVSPLSAPVGAIITAEFAPSDPDGGPAYWDLRTAQSGGGTTDDLRFGPSQIQFVFNQPGVHRFRAQAIDQELKVSEDYTQVVHIGDASGEPPIVQVQVDKTEGYLPLTVHYDATSSFDPDGTIYYYFISCEVTLGIGIVYSGPPTGFCNYDSPGPHAMHVSVQDNSGYSDIVNVYVNVKTNTEPDNTPPTVSIDSPAANSEVGGNVQIDATALDNIAVQKVEFYYDGNILIETDISYPYSVTWDASNVSLGSHTLVAKAYDQTNVTVSGTVPIRVIDVVLPVTTLTYPPDGAIVPRGKQITMTATASDNVGISKVEFWVDPSYTTKPVCTDTTSPYSCVWKVPSKPGKQYFLSSKAFDLQGNYQWSNGATVTAK